MISSRPQAPTIVAFSAVLLFMALMACFTSATAASAAGKVLFAFGEVSATGSDGTRRALARGDVIAPGDTIVTAKGRVQIRLTDGGFVALNPNTEYAVEAYEYEATKPAAGRSFFNLVRGGVRLVTGSIGRVNRARWRMRTSVATIGIRGSGGYFRYINAPGEPDELGVDVDFGGFFATGPDGRETDLDPSRSYVCAPVCAPRAGAGQREDHSYVEPPEDTFESGDRPAEDILDEDIVVLPLDPIPAGEAPDGTHVSISYSFIESGPFLNSLADGEETDGMLNAATFGSLERFEWFTGFPCEPCIFNANGGEQVVDPAPDGSTFNTELSTEWGRVVDSYTVTSITGSMPVAHFHHVESTDPTPVNQLPTGGTLIYDEDVGGTLATHTFGTGGAVELATQRTKVKIVVDYGAGGNIDDFRVSGKFPSGTTYVLQSVKPTTVNIDDGYLVFDSLQSSITVPNGSTPSMVTGSTMCAGGCTFYGTAVFGAAGPDAIGVTGAFQGNTAQPSYPPHSVNGAFVVRH